MKIIIIPMKGKNERLPRKNVLNLFGRPLCYYLLSAANLSEADEVILDIACPEIEAYAENLISDYSWEKTSISRRPTEYCDPMFGGNKLLERFILENNKDDLFIQAHVTSPFLKAETLNKAFNILQNVPSAFSCTKIAQRLWLEDNGPSLKALNHDPWGSLLRTQDLPPVYMENGAFFAFRGSYYLGNSKRRNGPFSFPVVLDFPETVDVDTRDDFILAERLMENLPARSP